MLKTKRYQHWSSYTTINLSLLWQSETKPQPTTWIVCVRYSVWNSFLSDENNVSQLQVQRANISKLFARFSVNTWFGFGIWHQRKQERYISIYGYVIPSKWRHAWCSPVQQAAAWASAVFWRVGNVFRVCVREVKVSICTYAQCCD